MPCWSTQKTTSARSNMGVLTSLTSLVGTRSSGGCGSWVRFVRRRPQAPDSALFPRKRRTATSHMPSIVSARPYVDRSSRSVDRSYSCAPALTPTRTPSLPHQLPIGEPHAQYVSEEGFALSPSAYRAPDRSETGKTTDYAVLRQQLVRAREPWRCHGRHANRFVWRPSVPGCRALSSR